jgi:hypothetical protein
MTDKVKALLELQRRQQRHDMTYHPDILSLTTTERLKHMALHNAKYAARFVDSEYTKDDEAYNSTLIDAFVISVATANTLTLNLAESLNERSRNSSNSNMMENNPPFSHLYLREVGLMAKACESIDHLEDYPFRESISRANLNMFSLLQAEAVNRDIDIFSVYESRLLDVEKSSGFRIFDENASP